MKMIKHGFNLLILLFSTFILAGCNNPAWDGWGEWDGEVIYRTQSIDGITEALIVEGSLGATTGFSSRIYFVAPGTEFVVSASNFNVDKAIFRADGVQGLSIGWVDSETLEIKYKSARIFHFSNFTDSVDTDGKTRRYWIKLTEESK